MIRNKLLILFLIPNLLACIPDDMVVLEFKLKLEKQEEVHLPNKNIKITNLGWLEPYEDDSEFKCNKKVNIFNFRYKDHDGGIVYFNFKLSDKLLTLKVAEGVGRCEERDINKCKVRQEAKEALKFFVTEILKYNSIDTSKLIFSSEKMYRMPNFNKTTKEEWCNKVFADQQE